MSNSSDRHDVLPPSTDSSPKPDLNSSLELAFETANYEVKLARLLVDVARAARIAGDIARADEARARGMAAFCRATQLSGQVIHKDKRALLAELNALHLALTRL